VAERRQPPVGCQRREAPEASSGDVLEEHTLDRILAAEGEDLPEGGLEWCLHGSSALYRAEAVT
jgi:hypothetical protein